MEAIAEVPKTPKQGPFSLVNIKSSIRAFISQMVMVLIAR